MDASKTLQQIAGGDDRAVDELLLVVYDELRKLADRFVDGDGHVTLQPTALVHEVYLRLLGRAGSQWTNRGEFFAAAALAMRHLLIDYARRRHAAKRGGDVQRVSLEDVAEPAISREAYLVALDDALTELARVDPQLSRVVELRFFGGLTYDEIAEALQIGKATVTRDWRFAKAWLQKELEDLRNTD